MIETKTLKRSSTNSDIKMEVNAISDYLKPNMPLPQYLPYARFLLDTDLSHTAKLLYTLLLDRATLSQKNNWMDERGFVYVIFPLSSLSDALRCSTMSIKRALHSLEDADLIERRRGRITMPNSIFVKVPAVQKCSPAWNDFVPSDGTKMISSMEQKCSTNQRYKNNLKDSHLINNSLPFNLWRISQYLSDGKRVQATQSRFLRAGQPD